MILTKKDIRNLREKSFLRITAEQEAAILERFGSEPGDGNVWSEQDIHEQVRKMLQGNDQVTITLPGNVGDPF